MARARLSVAVGLGGVALAAPILLAQSDAAAHPCDRHSGAVARVCRAGSDAIIAIVPTGGLAVGAGNPSLGTAGGSRRFGELTITLRGTYARAVLPATSYDGTGDTVPAASRLAVAVPRLDFRLGLVRRALPAAAVSVDLLGAVIGIPRGATEAVRFGPDVRSVNGVVLGFGYGLRIAIEPRAPLPVVSLNVARHDLPSFSTGDLSQGSTFAYTLSVSALNARLLVGKRFGPVELTGGAGADLLTGNYSLVYADPVTDSVLPRVDSTRKSMRFVALTNAALLLGPLRLTVEAGFQVGKDEKLPTIFEANDTRSGRFFGGVGIGFHL